MMAENWHRDILVRDMLRYSGLIAQIANILYPEIYSTAEREAKLLEIPEMLRLYEECQKRHEYLEKIYEPMRQEWLAEIRQRQK